MVWKASIVLVIILNSGYFFGGIFFGGTVGCSPVIDRPLAEAERQQPERAVNRTLNVFEVLALPSAVGRVFEVILIPIDLRTAILVSVSVSILKVLVMLVRFIGTRHSLDNWEGREGRL